MKFKIHLLFFFSVQYFLFPWSLGPPPLDFLLKLALSTIEHVSHVCHTDTALQEHNIHYTSVNAFECKFKWYNPLIGKRTLD